MHAPKLCTVLFAAVVLAGAGCDDGDGASLVVGPGGGTASVTGSISANHGHVATITGAELDAGVALPLDIRGTADHSHTVQLSGAEVVQIRNGQRVTTTSSTATSLTTANHSHTVTFN
jgi:hypothetical protein